MKELTLNEVKEVSGGQFTTSFSEVGTLLGSKFGFGGSVFGWAYGKFLDYQASYYTPERMREMGRRQLQEYLGTGYIVE